MSSLEWKFPHGILLYVRLINEGHCWGIFLISQETIGPLMVNLILVGEQDLLSGEKWMTIHLKQHKNKINKGFIMIFTFKLLYHVVVLFITHQSILSSYLSVAWRASFSSLNLVCKHFSSSVKVLTACSAFQRLSFSWSRSSTIVCIRYTCNENWTVNNKWWRIEFFGKWLR